MHRPQLSPQMGDRLQTFFNLFPTSLRINQCVGSIGPLSFAPPQLTIINNHAHANSQVPTTPNLVEFVVKHFHV
jgi:hypothetical protein